MKQGWEYKKLGEVCQILDKQRKPVTKSARTNGIYPYYGATGIQDYVAEYLFDGRFVLIGEDGAKWGACENTAFIIEGKSWVNNHAHILKLDSNIIDSFAVYFLNFSNLDSFITGAVVRKLTQASMKNIVLPLPPLSEQQAIVAELDKINEIIDLKKAQLKDLDLLAQSIFYEMFGDTIENPKGWEVKKLDEICEKITDGVHKKPEYQNFGVPFISVKDITTKVLDMSNCKYVSKEDHISYCKRCKPEFGDILYTKVGATYGRACIVDTNKEFSLYVSVCLIKLNKNLIIPDFAKMMLNSPAVYSQAVKSIKGIGTPDLHLDMIKKFVVFLPPLPLQQSFAEKIQTIESQKSAIKQSLAETETLLASRMDYYFS